MKIGFVASSGGHWEEILCLKEIADENESFFVTEKGGQAEDSNISNIYTVPQMNRHEKFFLLHFVKLFINTIEIMVKEKPDVIISTGALISFPFCFIGKLMFKKIIFIESFARVRKKSLTGKLVYPIADLFLYQWEDLKQEYPKGKYVGGIF